MSLFNDVTAQWHSWDARLKKPKLYYCLTPDLVPHEYRGDNRSRRGWFGYVFGNMSAILSFDSKIKNNFLRWLLER